jgi:Copper type II ascorbate-dependent monooxygenase, C-terminal domain
MRLRFALALALAPAAACGGGGTGTPGDDTVTPDAPPFTGRGFQLISPDIVLQHNEQVTRCFGFKTSNTETLAINHWKSKMTVGSHHMIMFLTNTEEVPAGTVTPGDCGFGGSNPPTWTYAAQTEEAEMALPIDDGGGKPLAQSVGPGSFGYIQMHYLNATDNPMTVHVELTAEALDAGVPFTQTAAFITYNDMINIPANAVDFPQTQTCNTPPGAKFWLMSTHAHKQAVHTSVADGSTMMFQSDDWEHPGAATFMTPDKFFTFAGGKVTYECRYTNPNPSPIVDGNDAALQEMCMATGYYFPATRPRFCLDSFLVP